MWDSDMENISKCEQCDNPATISLIDGAGGCIGNICNDCYNRLMSINYEDAIPDDVPEILTFKGRGRKTHVDYYRSFYHEVKRIDYKYIPKSCYHYH